MSDREGSACSCRARRRGGSAAGSSSGPPTARNNKALAFLRGLRLVWCGTRRTVCFCGARFFGRLEFAGKFGVPQLVTINKSASYGVQWNRTRLFLTCRMLLAYKAIIQNCLWNSKPPDIERCRSLLPLRIGRIAQKKTSGVVTENR